ncbi:LacI family DNA-binding transcriptional regulator [Paenibacillus koleovorans]|uniref:LacI family DNA-binding transcriptional regulator n=1 Tax=Paenibacillus koleovorans TaxID=121608 RepID=UPI000FDA3BD8|nr:LacI family DNA-binding transcriptional regulator [Paenibacillus koleovorans]
MTVTIRQIAEKAGVSRGTVDRVLNGRSGVKPEVRERIMEIVDELQYVPNLAAKALAFNKKPVRIGIVLPPRDITFFEQITSGIQAAADELQGLGIQLDYLYADNRRVEAGAAAIRQLIDEGASGILYAMMDDDLIRAHIDEAAELGIPVVTMNSDVEQSKRICFVGQDLKKSGVIAAGLMRRMLRGPSRVLVITSNLQFHAHRARVSGFREGIAGSRIHIEAVIESFDRYEDTYNKVLMQLKSDSNVDGIYMATGHIGGCLDAVRNAGLAGKLRFVCNDIIPEVEEGMKQGIIDFTIMQNPMQQGYRSLRILYDLLLTGKRPDAEYYYTETSIVIPESL